MAAPTRPNALKQSPQPFKSTPFYPYIKRLFNAHHKRFCWAVKAAQTIMHGLSHYEGSGFLKSGNKKFIYGWGAFCTILSGIFIMLDRIVQNNWRRYFTIPQSLDMQVMKRGGKPPPNFMGFIIIINHVFNLQNL